jgi:putative ABC transport system permease protein
MGILQLVTQFHEAANSRKSAKKGFEASLYNVKTWLGKFTYHTAISWWVFMATMFITILICLITVSWQAVKTAWTNPVKSLRSE